MVDTACETVVIPELPNGVPTGRNAATRQTLDDADWVAVAGDLEVSGLASARMRTALDNGMVIVANPDLSAADTWWVIDPNSGATLGVDRFGYGSETTETVTVQTSMMQTLWSIIETGETIAIGLCAGAKIANAGIKFAYDGKGAGKTQRENLENLFCTAEEALGKITSHGNGK